MQFLKKHYEKVLLGFVLLGLTVAVGSLPFIISSKREKLEASRTERTNVKAKPIPPLEMALLDRTLQRAQSRVMWNFTKDHNLVNPVKWQKMPDGSLVKGEVTKAGPEVIKVLNITPLMLRLGYDAQGTGGSYLIGFTNEAAVKQMPKSGELRAEKDKKNDLFTLREVSGPAEKPVDLTLELTDGTSAHLIPGKPLERVEGYEADMVYPPDPNKTFRKKRRDDTLNIAGEDYKIVVITASNVVVSAKQNNKKTTINFSKP